MQISLTMRRLTTAKKCVSSSSQMILLRHESNQVHFMDQKRDVTVFLTLNVQGLLVGE